MLSGCALSAAQSNRGTVKSECLTNKGNKVEITLQAV